jgi:hypothetical protein
MQGPPESATSTSNETSRFTHVGRRKEASEEKKEVEPVSAAAVSSVAMVSEMRSGKRRGRYQEGVVR